MKTIISYWTNHGTKILGGTQAALSGMVAISGLIPPEHIKYWLAANVVLGAMTINRGFTNSRQ